MAGSLQLNEDLAEAVALAHDLGHTPFGHSGEDALAELMTGRGGFEHNRHTVRIVDLLEQRIPRVPGLNLSHETRECLAKHRSRYDKPVSEDFSMDERPPLEGQIVDLADSIAYNSHDLEDGLRAGLVDETECEQLAIWRQICDRIIDDHPQLRRTPADPLRQERQTRVVKEFINTMVTDALGQTLANIKRHDVAGVDDIRKCETLVTLSPTMAHHSRVVEEFLWAHLYNHHKVVRMARRARRFIERLFGEYIKEPRQMPREFSSRVEGDGLHRVVCDYLAGMTDRFAQDEYRRMFAPYERM
jgi:dGTPase